MNTEQNQASSIRHSSFRISHCIPLLFLTLLAGIIRFYHIGHPCLWYDESMVFWRTCGSYGQLLDCLRTDGFVPLHYSLIWVITRFFRHTPLVLRFVPALSGTLMVPAVYFFARQVLPRKTSLLAAAFTACSAFALFYSRDAKMYMDAWLFVTLNVACLLWWFRSDTATAWLCWIASGAAACGLQITSAIPVALSLLLLFTQNRMRWQQTLLWLTGVLLILAGPIGHYEKFNIWIDQVEEVGWQKSQLQWINAYNYGRTGPELLQYLGSSMVMGWEWPRNDDILKLPSERFSGPAMGAEIVFVILAAGCLPWRFGLPQVDKIEEQVPDVPPGLRDPQPKWRVLLCLSILIALPVYGFYCRSMPDFAGPVDWWNWIEDQIGALGLLALIVLIILGVRIGLQARRQGVRPVLLDCLHALLRSLLLVVVLAAVIALCGLMFSVMTAQSRAAALAGKTWESLWVPRYLGFIWPVFATTVAALLMRLPTRSIRIACILFLLGINLAVASFRIVGETEPPVDQMARDWVDAQASNNRTLIRTELATGSQAPGGGNLFSGPGEYYIDLYSHLHTDPPTFKSDIRLRENQFRYGFLGFGQLNLNPNVTRIIVWDQLSPRRSFNDPQLHQPLPGEDLLKRLNGWELSSESFHEARDCWIWQDLMLYRRREYVRR